MVFISLCGLFVIRFGLRYCGMFSAGSVFLLIISRLCFESMYLGLMNFLFLMYVPPLGVPTLYVL